VTIRRVTQPTVLVLRSLLAQPGRRWYGLELCRATGLPSGTLYPIIARLEQEGWLASEWEDPKLHESRGRARRRYYWMTGAGAAEATALLERRPHSTAHRQPSESVP
jgi:PadR family transcriptional regulator, regulatory protein PadR